jgi:hypothetical protein
LAFVLDCLYKVPWPMSRIVDLGTLQSVTQTVDVY